MRSQRSNSNSSSSGLRPQATAGDGTEDGTSEFAFPMQLDEASRHVPRSHAIETTNSSTGGRRGKNDMDLDADGVVAASAPVHNDPSEFGFVQRHVRKTSFDIGKVGLLFNVLSMLTCRARSDGLTFHPTCKLSTQPRYHAIRETTRYQKNHRISRYKRHIPMRTLSILIHSRWITTSTLRIRVTSTSTIWARCPITAVLHRSTIR